MKNDDDQTNKQNEKEQPQTQPKNQNNNQLLSPFLSPTSPPPPPPLLLSSINNPNSLTCENISPTGTIIKAATSKCTASTVSFSREIKFDSGPSYAAPTISALVRGIHDTRTHDVYTLQLPLIETDNEDDYEEDKENCKVKKHKELQDKQPASNEEEATNLIKQKSHEPTLKTKSHSYSNTVQNSPKKLDTLHHHLFHLHPSLPRFVVDLATDPTDVAATTPVADNNNGDGVTHKVLEAHAPPSPGGARRLSQFNFNLRRFSHAHPATVLLNITLLYFF